MISQIVNKDNINNNGFNYNKNKLNPNNIFYRYLIQPFINKNNKNK